MACFDNLIGIEYCESESPTSGKYLKDGGVSLNELNMIAGQDYKDGVEFGEGKIDFATQLITQDIFNHFGSKYKAVSLVDNGRIGFVSENMVSKDGANELRGLELKLHNTSDFIHVYIKSVELFTDYTGNISVYIYDTFQNKILDTFTLASVADTVSSVDVNKYYGSSQKRLGLAILYNANGIGSYQTTVVNGGCNKCQQNNYTSCNQFIKARGVYKDGSQVIESNLKGLGHTSGMSIQYTVECDHEAWICLHKKALAIPIIYKASAEILNYAMFQTERTNYETMDKDQLKERRDFYELQYREYMDKLLQNMNVPNDNTCFICTQRLVSRQQMP